MTKNLSLVTRREGLRSRGELHNNIRRRHQSARDERIKPGTSHGRLETLCIAASPIAVTNVETTLSFSGDASEQGNLVASTDMCIHSQECPLGMGLVKFYQHMNLHGYHNIITSTSIKQQRVVVKPPTAP